MAAGAAGKKGGKPGGLTQDQIIMKFNQMRQEQRIVVNKMSELEAEVSEHTIVIETLLKVDPARKCFRMVGGILSERTVNEVLPALQKNKTQIEDVIEKLKTQLAERGQELNKFREEHNIQIRGEKAADSQAKSTSTESSSSSGGGVLVSNAGGSWSVQCT